MRLFGVLGTWMEEDVVAAAVRNAFVQGCERVYLVDNGSSDETVARALSAGGQLARTFVTPHYDEYARLAHMNGVVADVSAGEPDEHLWWLFMDADEFVHGPNGLTAGSYVRTLDQMFRVVGTRYLNHYPGPPPHYEPGRHPLDYQPLAEEVPWMMCGAGHRKHPLLRFDRNGPVLLAGRGFHIPECSAPIIEPSQPAFLHHFPFRGEAVTRRRLATLWEVTGAGETRAISSDDAAGHMLERFRSLDAVYSGMWSEVDNFFTGEKGVEPRPWTELVESQHHAVARPGPFAEAEYAPRVSIIVIFLNGMPFLEEAIQSARTQTFSDWELLLVDDGSDDGSTAVALAAAASDPERVHYLEHPAHANRGMSASRNCGLREARGEFVAFLDADDAWLPEKLAVQVRHLESRPDVDFVYGNSLMWFSWTGDPSDVARDCPRGTGIAAGTVVMPPDMLVRCFPLGSAPSPATSGYLVRRAVLERVGGSEESFRGLFEDQALLAKLYRTATFLVTDDRLDKYRMHPRSCMTRAVNSRTLDSATATYLSWLGHYLDRHEERHPAVRRLLLSASWPYRFPRLHRIRSLSQRLAASGRTKLVRAGIRMFRDVTGRSTGHFTATPNPAASDDRFGAIVVSLRWDVHRARAVEVRLESPAGTLLVAGGPTGELTTGKWVRDGTVFYLQDVSDGRPLTLRHTIGIVTMRVDVGDTALDTGITVDR